MEEEVYIASSEAYKFVQSEQIMIHTDYEDFILDIMHFLVTVMLHNENQLHMWHNNDIVCGNRLIMLKFDRVY